MSNKRVYAIRDKDMSRIFLSLNLVIEVRCSMDHRQASKCLSQNSDAETCGQLTHNNRENASKCSLRQDFCMWKEIPFDNKFNYTQNLRHQVSNSIIKQVRCHQQV